METKIHIGCQGWIYDDWVGVFYPPKSRNIDLLPLYSKIFNSVEVDSTFYAIPQETTINGWYAKTPENFSFSLKLPSEITHKNRLINCEVQLFNFLDRALNLRQKLGCILIQLPPDFSPSEHKNLSHFLTLLPRNAKFAIEFRDLNWLNKSIIDELGEQGVALALADSKWLPRERLFEMVEILMVEFVYIRWLGTKELTSFKAVQIDRSVEFKKWVKIFHSLSTKTNNIYAYFSNFFQGHSPSSCNEFKKLLGLDIKSPTTLITQPSLF